MDWSSQIFRIGGWAWSIWPSFHDLPRDVAMVTYFGTSWRKLAYPTFILCAGITQRIGESQHGCARQHHQWPDYVLEKFGGLWSSNPWVLQVGQSTHWALPHISSLGYVVNFIGLQLPGDSYFCWSTVCSSLSCDTDVVAIHSGVVAAWLLVRRSSWVAGGRCLSALGNVHEQRRRLGPFVEIYYFKYWHGCQVHCCGHTVSCRLSCPSFCNKGGYSGPVFHRKLISS